MPKTSSYEIAFGEIDNVREIFDSIRVCSEEQWHNGVKDLRPLNFSYLGDCTFFIKTDHIDEAFIDGTSTYNGLNKRVIHICRPARFAEALKYWFSRRPIELIALEAQINNEMFTKNQDIVATVVDSLAFAYVLSNHSGEVGQAWESRDLLCDECFQIIDPLVAKKIRMFKMMSKRDA